MPDDGTPIAANCSSSTLLNSLAPFFSATSEAWQRRPAQNPHGALSFPLILRVSKDHLNTPEEAKLKIRELSKIFRDLLATYGTIYITNLPLPTPETFNDAVIEFGFNPFEYIGGAAPRTRIVGYTFTANEGPANRVISWHNEIAASVNHPLFLVFYCEQPAEVDGSTCVNYGAEALFALEREEPEIARMFKEKGFRYRRRLEPETDPKVSNGRGWKDTYNVSTRAEAEAVLASLNVTDFRWEENKDGSGDPTLLVSSPRFPRSKVDPRTGVEVFFNAACGAYIDHLHAPDRSSLIFGDGSEIPEGVMERAIKVVDSVGVKIPWESGGVLMVDNILCQHARTTYSGERARKVYASLWK